ncbi:MAG: hypothetical protein U1D35_19105, partial [Paracoccaceae bacterium]|nr:hypothetical protein [Paracoccaceae bacterium]
FTERLKHSGAIVVSHSMNTIRALCTAVAVLEEGKLTYFDDVERGIARHRRNMRVAQEADEATDEEGNP